MKFISLLILFFVVNSSLFSQEEKLTTTAFPFLLLNTDAIASGKGNTGVASLPDTFSQHWNSSKYVFSEKKTGLGMSYTPYLNHLVKDIFLGSLSYYRRTTRGAWAGSFTYFSIGNVRLVDDFQGSAYVLGEFRPVEFTFDISYNLRLSERFSLGISARYLRSDFQLPSEEKSVGIGFSSDISGYYISKEHLLGKYSGKIIFGFQISNLGTKIKYDGLGKDFFLPTNFKLGGGYFVAMSSFNDVSLMVEINKLLVPTALNSNLDTMSGIFKSFSDAPNGLLEELQEIVLCVGLEYVYDKVFFLRTGYFNQHKNKGGKKNITLGMGFIFKKWQFDFSYPLPVTKIVSPLDKSLSISLQYIF